MAIKLDEARIRSLTTNLLNGGIALNSLNYGTYALPLAGGKMTGTIHLGSIGLRTHDDTHGYYTDQYGNFFHCSNTSTDNWNVHNAAGTTSLKYYFETGALEIPTSLKMNTWNITDDGNCIYFRKASNTNYVGFDWNSNVGHIVGNSTSTNCGYGWHNIDATDDLAYVGANIQKGTLNYFWIGKDYNNLWMKISPAGRAEFMSTAGQNDHNGIIKVVNNSTYTGTGYHTVIRATAPKATGTQLIMLGPDNSAANAGYMGFYNTGTSGSLDNRLSFGLYAVDNVLNIMGNGKVGIGTVTPSTKFVVYSEDTSESVATFSTSGANPWIYFKSSGTTRVASVGYYGGLACLSNEKNYARIGVNDNGIPQYWTDPTGTAKYEIILGNAYENNTGPLRLKRGSGINNATNNYISAGRGYSTGSGLDGLKLIATEQDDAISGLGQDCTGKEYELSIAAALSTSNKGYITFVGHKIATPKTYSELGHFNFNSSVFYVNGKIGVGTTTPAQALDVNGVTQSKGLHVCNRGSVADTSSYYNSAIEVREYNFGGAQGDTWGVAPRVSFHWGGRVAAQIGLASNGCLYVNNNASTSTAFSKIVLEDNATWGINISGLAAKATADANGLNISTGYLKLSGGTMTGQIKLASTGLATYSENGYSVNQYGNFVHTGTETTDYWNLNNNAQTIMLKYYWETGVLELANTLKFTNALTKVNSPTVVATFIGNNSANGIGYSNTSEMLVGSATIPAGFTNRATTSTWGAISSNSYTLYTEWDAGTGSNPGAIAFMAYPSADRLSVKIDGYYYQNEGAYMCLDTNNYSSYTVPKSGGTFTGKVAISYAHTGSGMFQLMSTGSNEASMDYAAGGTSYWVVGKGCGGTGNGTFAWYYVPGSKNVMTLSSAGALAITTLNMGGNINLAAAASGTSPTAQRITINGVTGDSSVANAPGIGFHTGNIGWASIKCVASAFYFYNSECNGYVPIHGSQVYGAVWNDYAEYRTTTTKVKPGRVVVENNDDTLSMSTERLMPGANIVSDTFGFAIGETDDAQTPLAVSGRVLAYPLEPREEYCAGDPVCSGPNGTVSKMTREEVMMYPDRIIGTVSSVPNYDTWGTGNVKVNGRIWIKVR